MLIGCNNLIERVGYLSLDTSPGTRQSNREITVTHGLKAGEDRAQVRWRSGSNCGVSIAVLSLGTCAGSARGGDVALISLHRSPEYTTRLYPRNPALILIWSLSVKYTKSSFTMDGGR
jgi:hypothetical protein